MATVDLNKVPELKAIGPYEIISLKDRITRAKNLPPIKELVGSLIAEEELTIIFGRSGAGKTALAMQIGIAVARGKKLFSFLENEAGPLKVLYYDAEMQDRQLLNRLPSSEFLLPDNFDFMQANPNYDKKADPIIDQLIEVLGKKEPYNYQFVIIDNLHTLGERLEESGNSRELMMNLKKLVINKKITLVVIAHTPNIPETCKIESSMMQGSEVLKVFLDQQIAVGNSILSEDTKYIKVLKSRNRKNDFHATNVITTKLTKHNDFFVHEYQSKDSEALHYNRQEQKNKDLEESVLSVHRRNPEFSSREIVQDCEDAGVKVGKDKVLSILKANGIDLKNKGGRPKK